MRALETAIPPRLRRRLERWLDRWGTPSLASTLRIEFSPRLRRSFGRCYQEQRVIRLAASLGGSQSWLLDEILCHEAAHAAVYELHGADVPPHGEEWEELMRVAGFEPRMRIPVVVQGPSREASKGRVYYVHRCPSCERSCRATRPMQQWRCRSCLDTRSGGRLLIQRESAKRTTRRKATKSSQACRRRAMASAAKATAPKRRRRRVAAH